jgi:DNA-binding transcriptional LysR family regulator
MNSLHKISWDWIRSYFAVAERGSVAGAAAYLHLNAATVSRQVSALEQHLGVELFVRSRDGMQPTLAGQQFMRPANAMQNAMTELSMGAASKYEKLQGIVRISASVSLVNFVLPELLAVFRGLQPNIQFELIATDLQSNLLKREADIAIRFVQPIQDELIAKRVAHFSLGLYASHSYLARYGLPKLNQEQLMGHYFIDVAPQHPVMKGFEKMGMPRLTDRLACVCSDHASAWQMAMAGLGITASLAIVGDREPSVRPVLPEVRPGRFPVWLVTHRGLRMQPRLRMVADYLTQALKSLGN